VSGPIDAHERRPARSGRNEDLNEGSAYEVEIQVLGDGTLYAVEIEPSDDGENVEQEGEHDGENEGENAGC